MKAIIQGIGDETLTVQDQVYYVAEQVKKYLPGFQIGQEVDINFKEVDGVTLVTFCKPAGVPVGGQQQYRAPQGYQQPPQQYQTPRPAQTPVQPPRLPVPGVPAGINGLKGDINKLTAAIIVAYQLDPNEINRVAALLK